MNWVYYSGNALTRGNLAATAALTSATVTSSGFLSAKVTVMGNPRARETRPAAETFSVTILLGEGVTLAGCSG